MPLCGVIGMTGISMLCGESSRGAVTDELGSDFRGSDCEKFVTIHCYDLSLYRRFLLLP